MVHVCMVHTERTETAAVSCGTSHASAVSIYTTSVDIQKRCYKKLITHVEKALVEFMLCTLHLHACQVRVTVGD